MRSRSPRPERSEEFVNDRKATRSYLRTHMRSLSAPVNNLHVRRAHGARVRAPAHARGPLSVACVESDIGFAVRARHL